MNHFIAPSILSADFGILKEQIELINGSSADFIHVDVMDGVYVPNISFGFPIVEAIAKHAKKPLDIHLMIVDPDRFVERFAGFHPEYITVHFEACPHLNRTLNFIKSFDVKAGLALNPHTAIGQIEEVISIADLVLIMSVNPGFGGQKFIPESLQKLKKTRDLIINGNYHAKIEVDGGINQQNISDVVHAGAEIVVAGNSVFGGGNIISAIENLKRA
jgi:ribulose-phosphate 3-epimerase